MDWFGGMYCCLGGLMGSPMVPDCWYGVPGEGWGWGRWVGGLTLDFRPMLPVITHDQGVLGKNGSFWGYVLLFGRYDGPPVVELGSHSCCQIKAIEKKILARPHVVFWKSIQGKLWYCGKKWEGFFLKKVTKQGRHPANSCEKSWILLNLFEFVWIYLNLLEFYLFSRFC